MIVIKKRKRYIGNAVLDNFEQDIGITPDQFNACVTIFYVSNVFYRSLIIDSHKTGRILDLSNT